MAMSAAQRSLCVLVADATASPALLKKLGASEARRAIDRCLNRVERAAVVHRGRLTATKGDQAAMVFDTAEEGLLAACDMQQKIDDLPPVSGLKLAVRIGLSVGEASETEGALSGDGAIAATRFARLALPAQVIISDDAVRQLPLPSLASVRQLNGTERKQGAAPLWEVLWRGGAEQVQLPSHFAPTQQMELKLRLRYGDTERFITRQRNSATLGRDKQSDIVIRDPRASRHHARIELRLGKFVLVDQSTNGTWVSTDEDSCAVKKDEMVLRGKGRLTFGQAYKEDIADFIEYIVID